MDHRFGCSACCGDQEPETAFDFCIEELKLTHRLIDESHFGVSIRVCPKCRQRFVGIFTEFIDWSGGDDSQFFDLVPLTQSEADRLIAADDRVSLDHLGELGIGRRRLVLLDPTGGPRQIVWATGAFKVVPGH